jgi:LacI family transcriptional regulator
VENQRPTIAEIAAAAGVSIPTVSKVLNRRPDVAPLTRKRIELILAERGYTHSRGERDSEEEQTQATKLIDLIMPGPLDTEYYLEILCGIEEVLAATEYRLALFSLHENTPREQQWFAKVSKKFTDGALVLTPVAHTRHLEKLRQQNIPFVTIDDVLQLDRDIPSIGATNWTGGLAATEYLLSLGHRRIAIITGISSHLTTMARLAGYRAALEAVGVSPDPELIRPGDFHQESGFTQTLALLDLAEPPTAIFALSDVQACGVYQALYARGFNVPDDISVIGFDDVPGAARMSPPLTTIRQPLKEMGRLAAQMLLRMIAGEALDNKRVELMTSLVMRESCAPASQSGA